jgi:hypothetical protein
VFACPKSNLRLESGTVLRTSTEVSPTPSLALGVALLAAHVPTPRRGRFQRCHPRKPPSNPHLSALERVRERGRLAPFPECTRSRRRRRSVRGPSRVPGLRYPGVAFDMRIEGEALSKTRGPKAAPESWPRDRLTTRGLS